MAVELLLVLPLGRIGRCVVKIVLHFAVLLLALLGANILLLHHHFELLTIRHIIVEFFDRLNGSHRLLSGLLLIRFIFECIEFVVDHCGLDVELP